MPPSLVTCPRCHAQLGLAAIPPGGKIKCGKCGTTLTVAAPPPPAPQAIQPRPAVALPPLPPTAPVRAAVMARREHPARRPEKTGLSGMAVAALCSGGVFLLSLVVLAVVFVLTRSSDTPVLAAPAALPEVAVKPVQPVAVVQPAPVPVKQPDVVAPAVVPEGALSDQELNQILQILNVNTPWPQLNPALERLSAARPQDAQRDRVLKALEPLVEVKAGVDCNAVKAMGVWGNRDTVTFLLRLAGTDNIFMRHECLRSLGRLRDERAAEVLVQRLLAFQDRGPASQGLRAMGPAAEKAVLPLLNHGDVFVRREVCAILEIIGTAQSINPLRQAVRDGNGLVRRAAENALTAVQGRAGR